MTQKFKVYGWNALMSASGYLKETVDTRKEAEELAKKYEWMMDDFEIHEISANDGE